MAECGKYIGHGTVNFPCSVEPPGHDGPCMAQELPRTVEERRKWSHDNSGLGQFQGAPQTVAEGLHADPEALTAVPGLRPRQALQEARRLDHIAATTPQGYTYCTGCGSVFDEDLVGEHLLVEHSCPGERTAVVAGIGPPMTGVARVKSGPEGIKEVDARLTPPEPTKQREGDQVLPTVNELPFVQDAVITDIEERKAVGIQRYGTPLQAFNGRDSTLDAYEEALDLTMYLKQMRIERDEIAKKIGTLHQVFTSGTFEDIAIARSLVAELAHYFDA